MQNCKQPNNGGNVLVRQNGEIELFDQSGSLVSHFEDWSKDVNELDDSKVSKSAFNSYKSDIKARYAHSLELDGNTLKLYNDKQTPTVLSSVELPASGGASKHAHAMALYFNATTEEDNYVKCEYAADGIRIKAHTTLDSAVLRFEVELTDPTKFVFDPNKPVYWRYLSYNSSLQVFEPIGSAKNTYIPALVTPADATSPLLCTQSLDWQTYDTDRVIIEVFAELVAVE